MCLVQETVSALVFGCYVHVRWSPSIAATVGEWYFGCYMEVAVVEGFQCLMGTRAVGRYIADGCC